MKLTAAREDFLTPLRIVEHHGRNADVRQNSIDVQEPVLFGYRENIPKVGFGQDQPIAARSLQVENRWLSLRAVVDL